jgi:CubicO group peptidase (beta-lactamase class C family)
VFRLAVAITRCLVEEAAPMSRLAFLASAAALLPALLVAGCGETSKPAEPALAPAALEAVAEEPGVDRAALARAIDALFTGEGIGENPCVIVMHGGEIVAQRYAAGYGPRTNFVGWSMSKTVTGVLIGMMIADGRLRLDDSPPIPRWQRAGDPRSEITLRQLLQMRSGLRHEEKAEPVYTSAEVRMMFLDGATTWPGGPRRSRSSTSRARVRVLDPDRDDPVRTCLRDRWCPTGRPAQRQQAVSEFVRARMAVPLKMPSLTAEFDRAGR